MQQVEKFYSELLETPFDFSKPGTISLDYETAIRQYSNRIESSLAQANEVVTRIDLPIRKKKKKKKEADSSYVMKSDLSWKWKPGN